MTAGGLLTGSVRGVGLAVALVTAPLAVLEVLAQPTADAAFGPPPEFVGVALALLATLPYARFDARPLAVVVLAGVALGAGALAGHFTNMGALAGFVGVGLVAYRDGAQRVAVALPVVGGSVMLALAVSAGGLPVGPVLINGLAMVFVAVVGLGVRRQRQDAAELRARTRELEALREVETQAAVAQERVRIAREVHDAVGHTLAAIALHARVADRRLERDRPAVAQALAEITELASSALADTRDAVGQLRSADLSDLRPAPGLDDLDELLAGLRATEMPVTLRREGGRGAVPQAVQAAAFRIVQESLSNVARHAGGAGAEVLLRCEPEALVVVVADDGGGTGTGDGAPESGHGLAGMRERAVGLGGTFAAGPGPEGGWRVRASLPLRPTGAS